MGGERRRYVRDKRKSFISHHPVYIYVYTLLSSIYAAITWWELAGVLHPSLKFRNIFPFFKKKSPDASKSPSLITEKWSECYRHSINVFFLCFSLTLTFLSRECSFLFCQECLGSTGPVVTSSRLAMWAGQARQQEHICFSNLLTLVCVHSYRSCCLSRQKGFAFIFFYLVTVYGVARSVRIALAFQYCCFWNSIFFLQIFWKLIFLLMHVWRNYLMTWFQRMKLIILMSSF